MPPRSTRAGRLALLVLLAAQLLSLVVIFRDPENYLNDYRILDVTALAMLRGVNPYFIARDQIDALSLPRWGRSVDQLPFRRQPLAAQSVLLIFSPYSPLSYLAIGVFASLPPSVALLAWSLAGVAAALLAALLLGKLRAGQWLDPPALLATALFPPVLVTLAAGQANTVLLLLLLLACQALQQRRAAVAGCLLAFSLLFKPLTVSLSAWQLWQRRWRELAWTLAALALWVVAGLPWTGLALYGDYLAKLLFLQTHNNLVAFVDNQSLWGLLASLLPTALATPAALLLSAALAALAAFVLWRSPRPDALLGVSLAVVGVALVSPVTWLHHLVLLLLPLLVLLRDPARWAPLVVAVFALIILQVPAARWWGGLPLLSHWATLALVLLFAALCLAIRAAPPPPARAATPPSRPRSAAAAPRV